MSSPNPLVLQTKEKQYWKMKKKYAKNQDKLAQS